MSALAFLLLARLCMGGTAIAPAVAKDTWRSEGLPAGGGKDEDPLKGKNFDVSGIALSGDRKRTIVASGARRFTMGDSSGGQYPKLIYNMLIPLQI
jgi:hypothetical protein